MKRIYATPLILIRALSVNDVVRNSLGSGDPDELLFRDGFN